MSGNSDFYAGFALTPQPATTSVLNGAGNQNASSLPAAGSSGNLATAPHASTTRVFAREPVREMSDDQMDQVRDLLFGTLRRDIDARLSRLETRADALEAKIASLAAEVTGERRTAFDTLSRGVNDLAEQIRQISRL